MTYSQQCAEARRGLEWWLRGMAEGGRETNREEIRDVYRAILSQVQAREGRDVEQFAGRGKRVDDTGEPS